MQAYVWLGRTDDARELMERVLDLAVRSGSTPRSSTATARCSATSRRPSATWD
ncbi:hypothetical protein [Arsenicicoccus piscis]|uniref:hypothetical protein n=1 Tax=Arsenicicoccus piscis TaxID=673954 RepID=UPI0024E0A774|nr:hypothetical protein [Arsenicicoccus piscis]